MEKFNSKITKERLFKSLLTALIAECSFPVYYDKDDLDKTKVTCQVSKFDLQFVHRIEGTTKLSACIYDHYELEYRVVERRDGTEINEAYYTVGLSVL